MRMRKKPNLIPRMDRCRDRMIPDPVELRGHWRDLMPQARELRVELGCGKGRFTAETAGLEPDVLFVAVERVPDAMIVAMERVVEKGLSNVFFVDGDAARLRDYFSPGEADRIYINFCDPWPSNKHARRRLTHENFLVLYRGVLRDGGQIHFKTDNRELFEYSLFQFPKAGYELSEVTRDLHGNGVCGIMTDYEEKFHDLGTRGDQTAPGAGAEVSAHRRAPGSGAAGRRQGAGGGPIKKEQYRGGLFRRGTAF